MSIIESFLHWLAFGSKPRWNWRIFYRDGHPKFFQSQERNSRE